MLKIPHLTTRENMQKLVDQSAATWIEEHAIKTQIGSTIRLCPDVSKLPVTIKEKNNEEEE